MANTVNVGLGLIIDGFNLALKSAEKQTETFSKKAVSNFQVIEKSFAVMAGVLAANAFEKIASGVKDAFNNIIDEAASSEEAINKLNIALKSAGLFSVTSSASMQEFAGKLQAVTIYSDEAIMSSSSLLLSLTNLDKNGVQAATKAAANLAATLGIDLSEATDMIAKAINGNVMAFKKKGIAIQSADTDAERLTNTLAALATQEGAAEAATNTYTGAKAKQANQQSELLESLGKLITQNNLVKESINSATQAYADSAEWITNNKKFIDDLTTSIVITTGVVATAAAGFYVGSAALGVLAIAAATGVTAFQALGIAAGVAWGLVTAPVTLVVAGIALVGVAIYALVKYWDDLKAATYNALAAGLDFAADMTQVFSGEKAAALRNQANAWRDKAAAIKENSAAAQADAKAEAEQAAARDAKLKEEAAAVARINANKAESRRINRETIAGIEAEADIAAQEAEVLHLEAMNEIRGESDINTLATTLEKQEELLVAKQEHEQAMLQLQIDAETNKANLETDAKARMDALRVVNDKANIDRAKLRAKQEVETEKQKNKSLEALAKESVEDRKNTLNLFSTLATSASKELAAIGKAAALTQIAIDTPKAASSAFAYGTALGGPPVGFTFQAIAYAAQAAQAAKVVGINFADGGIVPGSDMSGDRIRANVNSGEMFLNRQQQATLFQIANGRVNASAPQNDAKTEQLIGMVTELASQPISIQIDGREIMNVIRNQSVSGRSFT